MRISAEVSETFAQRFARLARRNRRSLAEELRIAAENHLRHPAEPSVDSLRQSTRPVPGRPGWRVDELGIEWFSSAWLDEVAS